MIPVKMIKIYADSIAHPLTLIFQNSLGADIFANDCKKLTQFQFIKRYKKIVLDYRPISLLPICSKIFEKLIFDDLFAFLKGNLLFKHQSGFRAGDSCIYQLLAITRDSFLSFDSSLSLETEEYSQMY